MVLGVSATGPSSERQQQRAQAAGADGCCILLFALPADSLFVCSDNRPVFANTAMRLEQQFAQRSLQEAAHQPAMDHFPDMQRE
jgi:hypothetical protein